MITAETNERLTQTGPGTFMGNLLRRYWHPVGAAAELAKEPVQPVRLLGEDLTLFKDLKGNIGLIGERCAHRAISLAYGIPQENGLRCAYHGWTYNTEGRVVDMPFEPACLPLKVKAYPAQELGGLIWAYMGPEPAPLLPRWDILVREDMDREIVFKPLGCNWLQCMDNSFDPTHFEHLHGVYGNYMMKKLGKPAMLNPARHLKIEFDIFEYGVYKRRLVDGAPEDGTDWTVGHPVLFPCILAQGSPEQQSFQIRTPTDDTHTMHIVYNGRQRKPEQPPQESIPFSRETLDYDGLGRVLGTNIVKQDEMAWIGQGTISDRTQEHLATSDKGVILFHNLLLSEAEKVARGEEPMGMVRDPAVNEPYIHIGRGSRYGAFRAGVEDETYGGVRIGLAAGVAGFLKEVEEHKQS